MKYLGTATLFLLGVGLVPLPAGAGPIDTNYSYSGSTLSGPKSNSEKLGREAQRELARLGCFSGDVNEKWGREGRAALKRLNLVSQISWPDWPSVDLINGLKTYKDGYCRQCRNGEACSTASTGREEPSIVPPMVEPPAKAQKEDMPAPIEAPIQSPPTTPKAERTPPAAPSDSLPKNIPQPVPRSANIQPRVTPEENTRKPIDAAKRTPARKIQKAHKKKATKPKKKVTKRTAPAPKVRQSPVATRSNAKTRPSTKTPKEINGRNGWPSDGPDLSGR